MKASNPIDVLIVGAGPTGLALAIGLKRFGVACRIIDKATGPAITSRAFDCHARTVEILEDYGMLQAFLEHATILQAANLYNKGTLLARLVWDLPNAPYPWNYQLPQAQLEGLLRTRLQELGVSVEWETSFAGLFQDENGVTATLKDGNTIRCNWLVGCDGAHSRVRQELCIPFKGSTYKASYHLADVQTNFPQVLRESHLWLDPQGVLLAIPMDSTGHWRLFANTQQLTHPSHSSAGAELFQHLLDMRPYIDKRFHILDATWVSEFQLHRRCAEHYRVQRVFLAGDAAHLVPPFGGQGMNTGIQDAYNLAWKIAGIALGFLQDTVLQTYQGERRPVGKQLIRQEHLNAWYIGLQNPFLCALRNVCIRLILRWDAFRRFVFAKLAGLKIHYKGRATLTRQIGFKQGVQAGERAPDSVLYGNVPKRLFELFQGPHHTLLLFSGLGKTDAAYPKLESLVAHFLGTHVQTIYIRHLDNDLDGALHKRYGITQPTMMLIRPDGYIAISAPVNRHVDVARYMAAYYKPHLPIASGITLRQAKPSDAIGVAPLILSTGPLALHYLFAPHEKEISVLQFLEKAFWSNRGAFSYRHAAVAEMSGQLVGIAIGYTAAMQVQRMTFSTILGHYKLLQLPAFFRRARKMQQCIKGISADAFYISTVAVTPTARGKGVGDALVEYLESQAMAQGISLLQLHVAESNTAAQQLYERHGFGVQARYAPTKEEPAIGLQPQLLMQK